MNVTRQLLPLILGLVVSTAASAESGIEKLKWADDPQPATATPFLNGAEESISLADFEGKVVVVNLWATWCAPCIREMPTLDALQASLGGDDLHVIALSQDREGAKVAKPFLDKNAWDNLELYTSPDLAFARDAEIRGLPTTLVIDKQGREVARLEGTAEWDAEDIVAVLRDLISGKTPAGS